MAQAKKQEVVEKQNTAISTNVMDFGADAGAGFEEADADSYSVPFVRILQSNSPQCKKSDGAYIQGAEEGSIFNTATNKLMETLSLIPCHFRRVFIEWVPQDNGGGFVAEYDVPTGKDMELTLSAPDASGKRFLPNGNQLVDTRMHYCIDAVTEEPMVVCMSSTQLKKSRNWMTLMQSTKCTREDGRKFTPPMFSQQFLLETVPESNDKGSWFGWKITPQGFVENEQAYIIAKSFRDQVVSGKVEVKHQQDAEAGDDGDGTEDF